MMTKDKENCFRMECVFKINRASNSHIDIENYPPCKEAVWNKNLNDWIIKFDSMESFVEWGDKHGECIVVDFQRDNDGYFTIMFYDGWIE